MSAGVGSSGGALHPPRVIRCHLRWRLESTLCAMLRGRGTRILVDKHPGPPRPDPRTRGAGGALAARPRRVAAGRGGASAARARCLWGTNVSRVVSCLIMRRRWVALGEDVRLVCLERRAKASKSLIKRIANSWGEGILGGAALPALR